MKGFDVLRIYIAIDFDSNIKEYFQSISKKIKPFVTKGKFTELNNFHLTLRFIGEISEIELPKLKEILDISLNNIKPFSLKISNLGFFTKKKTSILWLGIEENEIIISLSKELSTLLQKNKIRFYNKDFMPHITFARQIDFIDSFDINSFSDFEKKEIYIEKISIMESKDLQGISVYDRWLKAIT
ncbi:MAG: RNA 2',3'-cyclic phosphodiesterase [Clostridium sp.]|uniref:RNA 2',3'-cyclic phosphodiesterase n=1 Tax=Clostridium sp. TaxID=1506 RepID=UPI003EE44621